MHKCLGNLCLLTPIKVCTQLGSEFGLTLATSCNMYVELKAFQSMPFHSITVVGFDRTSTTYVTLQLYTYPATPTDYKML